MMLSDITTFLASIFRRAYPRTVLFISHRTPSKQIELVNKTFDEVIVERSAFIPADLQFDFPSENVLFATKLVQDNDLAHLKCKNGEAIWIQDSRQGILSFRSDSDSSPATFFLSRDPHLIEETKSIEPKLLMAQWQSGIFLNGELRPIFTHDPSITFALVRQDNNLMRIFAAAARAEIRTQLFEGPTGLGT